MAPARIVPNIKIGSWSIAKKRSKKTLVRQFNWTMLLLWPACKKSGPEGPLVRREPLRGQDGARSAPLPYSHRPLLACKRDACCIRHRVGWKPPRLGRVITGAAAYFPNRSFSGPALPGKGLRPVSKPCRSPPRIAETCSSNVRGPTCLKQFRATHPRQGAEELRPRVTQTAAKRQPC